MATIDINALALEAAKELTPSLAKAFANALTQLLNGETPKAETPKADTPKKGGRKHKNVDSTFEVVDNEINYCEYSDKSIAIWGDTKERKDIIKQFGEHEKSRANFVTPLSAISSRPVGWTINKSAIAANGGIDALVSALMETGANVVQRDSVKDTFEANKAEREARKAEETPKADTPKDAPKEKPSIEPTPEQRKGKGKASAPKDASVSEASASASTPKAEAPKAAPKAATPKTIKALCYDNSKTAADGYTKTERSLIKRGGWYYYQGAKGALIYALIGKDCELGNDIYVNIAKVQGDITSSILPEFKTWDEISSDCYKAFEKGTLKASSALCYAYVDLGDQDKVNKVYDKIA